MSNHTEAEEAALEQARLDALMAWDGHGEIPAIVWDKMSAAERKAIEVESNALLMDARTVRVFTAMSVIAGAFVGAAEWETMLALLAGAGLGFIGSILMGVALHIPYWRAPRPPRLGAALRWTAEEMTIRQRARLEARGYQAGELTEVRQGGELTEVQR